jgi:hypothetical protein
LCLTAISERPRGHAKNWVDFTVTARNCYGTSDVGQRDNATHAERQPKSGHP